MPRKFYSFIYPQTHTKDTALIRRFLTDKEEVENDEPVFSCGQAWRVYNMRNLQVKQKTRHEKKKNW